MCFLLSFFALNAKFPIPHRLTADRDETLLRDRKWSYFIVKVSKF